LKSSFEMTENSQPPFRTGIGYDIHRFDSQRPLVLGGVLIPEEDGLAGHSDADCLTHALADALLGALALPDIGYHFPPGKESCRNIDSQKILAFAAQEVNRLGYRIANVDIMLIAEKPKIMPFIDAMRSQLSKTLGVSAQQIGIKATTNETLGAIGRKEGIACLANALIYRA